MQHFINHAAIERAVAEIFSSARARYHLMALLALATAAAAGLALAAIWLGVALLVEEARKAITPRVAELPPRDIGVVHLALDIVSALSMAMAPAMAWYAGGDLGAAMAVAMLAALLMNAALAPRRRSAACLQTSASATQWAAAEGRRREGQVPRGA